MLRIVEKIISILKRDPAYKIRSDYSLWQITCIVFYRGLQVLRGFYCRIFLRGGGLLFCGRRVIIEHGYMIRIGKNSIIGDNVQLNGLSLEGISLGDNVTIGPNSIFTCTGVIAHKGIGIKIGSNSAIGAQSFIGGQGGITIGKDVIMGPQVKIFSEDHNYDDPVIPIRKQGERRKGVFIEDNCWIGSGVTILDGVTIGMGSVVAAGAVVTRSIPPQSVVAGVPAKAIKSRLKTISI